MDKHGVCDLCGRVINQALLVGGVCPSCENEYLPITKVIEWMKENNLSGSSSKNIYKRLHSGLDWGFKKIKGVWTVSRNDLETKWKHNRPYAPMGRKPKQVTLEYFACEDGNYISISNGEKFFNIELEGNEATIDKNTLLKIKGLLK